MADSALYGMAPCFGHTGVTFHAENDRPGPGRLRGHFEAARGRFCGGPPVAKRICLRVCLEWPYRVTFDVENDTKRLVSNKNA